LVANLNSHKIVRRLANIRKGFFKHGSELQNAPGGLVDLEKQIRDMEQDPEISNEDLRVTRDKRTKWKQSLKENDDHLRALSEMKDDLGLKHRKRTDRIYDFSLQTLTMTIASFITMPQAGAMMIANPRDRDREPELWSQPATETQALWQEWNTQGYKSKTVAADWGKADGAVFQMWDRRWMRMRRARRGS
jgi:hypothetical protein